MNKYKEAFDELKMEMAYFRVRCNSEQTINEVNRWVLLKELIDKETPKKVVVKGGRAFCPTCCTSYAFKFNYCPVCGQAMDWSIDD